MESPVIATSVAIVTLLASASISQAVIITPSSLNDAFSQKDGSGSTYYYETSNTIGAQYYYNGNTGGDSVIKKFGYIEFNIIGIVEPPPGTYTLNLYFTGSGTYGTTVDAGYINHVSNSSTATGVAKNDHFSGTDTVYTVSADTTGWVSIDVTSRVLADINNGYDYSCFYLNYSSVGGYPEKGSWFNVNSADSALNKPYMSVPEPAACAAFAGMGVLGLALMRRRRV